MKCVKGMGKRNEREGMKKRWGENNKVRGEEKRHHIIIFPHSEWEEERGRIRNSGDTEDEDKSHKYQRTHLCVNIFMQN